MPLVPAVELRHSGSVYVQIVGEGRSYRETAELLGVSLAIVQRDDAEAVGFVGHLKAKGILKAVPPLNIPQVPSLRMSPLRDVVGKALRSEWLSRRLAVPREHGKELPPGVLLRARISAERAWLDADRQVADLLLNPLPTHTAPWA